MMQAINNSVTETRQAAKQQKYVLHLADTEGEIHYNEISSVAVSIHPDDISLIEATNTFSDMLSCCDLET